jgi:hypothetical protein
MSYSGKVFLSVLLSFTIPLSALSQNQIEPPCEGEDYKTHSQELKKLYDEDQADRADFTRSDKDKLFEMLKHDRVRINRVAEIFAKGCLKSAEDYLNAATVFQHGEVPDHFFQTYIWAKKAFDMGLENAGQMAGNGIDRYLMNIGQKQLYGGQAVTDPEKINLDVDKRCFCLWPMESTFPKARRTALKFKTKEQIRDWVKEMNKDRKGCSKVFCNAEAKPTPKGSVPGVW